MSKFSCLEDTDLDALFAELGIPEPDPEPAGPGRARAMALDYQPSRTLMPGWTVDWHATVNRELTPEEAEARIRRRRQRAERLVRMTPEELAEFRARESARSRERYHALKAKKL